MFAAGNGVEGKKKEGFIMSNELLDFTNRENFDFLNFSYGGHQVLKSEDKDSLRLSCEGVLHYAHATVQDMCLLGVRLRELKNAGTWMYVLHPQSNTAFFNYSFEDFCAYAFGFSKTRTSNLLRISKFVKLNGDTVNFIEKKYSKYNTSQLIELAAVANDDLKYFSPEMSVSDMRYAKNYIKWGDFFEQHRKDDFDIMIAARNWEERQNEKKPTKGVIPGQIVLEEIEELEESDELTKEIELIEELEENIENSTLQADEVQEDEETNSYESKESNSEYNLKTRAGVRKFLADYTAWRIQDKPTFFLMLYKYDLKNGVSIYAMSSNVCADIESIRIIRGVRYFIEEIKYNVMEVTKEQIEKYIAAHTQEM